MPRWIKPRSTGVWVSALLLTLLAAVGPLASAGRAPNRKDKDKRSARARKPVEARDFSRS